MEATETKIVRISTDDLPERQRLEVLREVYGRAIIKHDFEPAEERPFRFDGTVYSLPGFGLAFFDISPCRMPRGPQHVESDDLVLSISLCGQRVVQQRGCEAAVGVGEAVMTTCADPGIVTITAPSRLDACLLRTVPRDGELLRLLTGYLEAVQRSEVLTAPQLRDAVVTHIQDLVAATIGATTDMRHAAEERGIRAARLSAVLQAIADGSGDSTLTAIAVGKRLGVTPRYIHFLLEETGRSFTHHLLERRLHAAAALLRDPRRSTRRISDVAREAGFTDLSHFSRVFRRRFGMTPSDARQAAVCGST
jgi:AraC-like DNA-binding protein